MPNLSCQRPMGATISLSLSLLVRTDTGPRYAEIHWDADLIFTTRCGNVHFLLAIAMVAASVSNFKLGVFLMFPKFVDWMAWVWYLPFKPPEDSALSCQFWRWLAIQCDSLTSHTWGGCHLLMFTSDGSICQPSEGNDLSLSLSWWERVNMARLDFGLKYFTFCTITLWYLKSL